MNPKNQITANEFKRLFPSASKSTFKANSQVDMSFVGKNQFESWEQWEIDTLKKAYSNKEGVNIELISKCLNRSYASIACKAESLGITSRRGLHKVREESKIKLSDSQTERMKDPKLRELCSQPKWIKNNHPKGMLGKHHSEESKKSMSDKQIGIKKPIDQTLRSMKTKILKYGSINPNVKRGSWKAAWRIIGGIRKFYRSRWEANYARYLEFQKVNGLIKTWCHEKDTFWFNGIKRGCVSYLPDFKITNNDDSIEYHEVKGWMDSQSKTKIRRMAKYYPNITLRVFDGAWYRSNKLKLSGLISDWE